MKINETDLRSIIEEELKAFKNRKNVANSKHPSDVEPVEDPDVGGILSDDFEHVPEDVPAVVEKPQARVQDLTPIVKENRYSLRILLEQTVTVSARVKKEKDPIKAWAFWLEDHRIAKDNEVATDENDKPQKPEDVRMKFRQLLFKKLGHPAGATQIANMGTEIPFEDVVGGNMTGYDNDALADAFRNALPPMVAYRKKTKVDFTDDALGGRDSAGEIDINEARFVGGVGFHSPSNLSESEDLDEGHCGCGNPDMPKMHMPSDHDEEPRDLDHDKHEGSMARSQLRRAAKYSQKLGHMIRMDDDLPEWLEAKITKASDYLGSVYHYLDYEINGKK